jgi:hypothetical protein
MATLDEAIRLSEQMLELVEAGSWQQLAALDEQRQPLIQAYFEQPHVEADAVVRLKDLNDRIVGHLGRQRQQTRDRQLRMHQGQQAARQYRDNQ